MHFKNGRSIQTLRALLKFENDVDHSSNFTPYKASELTTLVACVLGFQCTFINCRAVANVRQGGQMPHDPLK